MPEPLFSVILPTYNRPGSLEACLEGLFRLDYPGDAYEVIVVNDGAPGSVRSREAVATPRLRVIEQAHQGPAAARNRGAGAAAGRYLAFIDDDCVPEVGWLRAFERRLAREPDALVGGRTVNAVDDGPYADATQLMVDFLTAYHDASAPDRTRFFPTSNLVVPAAAFRGLGGFDPQFALAGGEDRDFCDRWHASGGAAAFEPAAVVYHRHRLGMRHFLEQHFHYGRGALRFHRARAGRQTRPARTSPRFYLSLVLYPLTQRRPLPGATRVALLLAAQAATAAGYWWERATSAPSAAPA